MKKYADDYETVDTKDEKGREKPTLVYRGDYFEVALDEEGILRFRRNSFLLLAAIVVLHIGAGFVSNRGTYQAYVALPYVIAFFPLLYVAVGVFRLPKKKRKYRRQEIGLSFDRIKTASIILMVFLAVGVLGEIAFILFDSGGDLNVLEYLYLLFEALASAAVYFLISLHRQIHIHISNGQ